MIHHEKLSPLGQDWHERIDTKARGKVPEYMVEPLLRYVLYGDEIGSFLHALMSNDLMRTVGAADVNNTATLLNWSRLLYNDCPQDCFGSPEKVALWQQHGGLEGFFNPEHAADLLDRATH